MITAWIVAAIVLVGLAAVTATALFTAIIAGRVNRGFKPQGRFVETSAGRLHVLDVGAGPPVVLIHGLGGQVGNFSYGLIDALKARHRVIVIDRPGAGFSASADLKVTGVRRQAAVIDEVMNTLGVTGAVVVGHSLGGAIALALAIEHPNRVADLRLVAPLTDEQGDVPAPFRALRVSPSWLRRLVAHTVAVPSSILRAKTTMSLLFAPDPPPIDFATRGLGLLSLRPQAFFTASTDMVHANDDMAWLRSRYGALKTPVSVLFGRQDQVLDPVVHGERFVDQVPGARLQLIDGGHMIIVSAIDYVSAFIKASCPVSDRPDGSREPTRTR